MQLNKKWDALSGADKMTLYAYATHIASRGEDDPDTVSEWLDRNDAPNLKTLFRITHLILKMTDEQLERFTSVADPILNPVVVVAVSPGPTVTVVDSNLDTSTGQARQARQGQVVKQSDLMTDEQLPTLTEMWCGTCAHPDTDIAVDASKKSKSKKTVNSKRDIDNISDPAKHVSGHGSPTAKIARRLTDSFSSSASDDKTSFHEGQFSTAAQLGCYNEYLSSSPHRRRDPDAGDSADGSVNS